MDRASFQPQAVSDTSGSEALRAVPKAPSPLRVVGGGLRLAEPVAAPDPQWDAGFAALRDWLGIALDPVAAPRASGLRKMADWARSPASAIIPQFAPWEVFSPVTLQPGASADGPRADWMVSYMFEHGPGSAVRAGTLDFALFSPHPSACTRDEEGALPLPRLAVIEAMLHAARAEGRTRIAILVSASQRNAFASRLLRADRNLTREGMTLEVLAIEAALPGLAGSSPRWDAVIVMPEWRSIVFTLVATATGRKGPWPLLWFANGQALVRASSEGLVEAGGRLALDAPVLIQTLALTLHHCGMAAAARRLHEAATRLRDSGIVTVSRGSSVPYARTLEDADFLELVCAGMGEGHRAAPHWQALAASLSCGTIAAPARLSLIASNASPLTAHS